LGDHVAAGPFYHINLPSLLLHATAFKITICSSRAYWTCTMREKLCQSTCLLQILLHKNMLGGTNMFTQATWRKSGKASNDGAGLLAPVIPTHAQSISALIMIFITCASTEPKSLCRPVL